MRKRSSAHFLLFFGRDKVYKFHRTLITSRRCSSVVLQSPKGLSTKERLHGKQKVASPILAGGFHFKAYSFIELIELIGSDQLCFDAL